MNNKYLTLTLTAFLLALLLLCGAASAASITDCTITNTNVYSADSSTQYNIAPSGYFDSSSTATGISHVSGRYIYATGLTASPNPAKVNQQITFTITGQQGAAIKEGTNKAVSGYAFTYESGVTGTDFTHTYTTAGIKAASVKLTNPGDSTGVSLSVNVAVEAPPVISAVTLTSPTPAHYTAPITAAVTASSPAGTAITYQWYVSTNSGSTWSAISGATTATLTYTPAAAGTYTFKVTATNSAGSTDSWTAGFRSVTAKALNNPTFTQQPVFSTAQGTLTAQPSMSFVANANVLGDTSVHIHSNTVQVSGTGGTWQEATTNTFVGGVWTLVKPVQYSDTAGTTHTYTTTVTTFVGSSWDDPNKRIIGEVTSEPFSFTTYAAPVISGITAPDITQVGAPFTFSASATDANTITYQLSSNSGSSWTDITSPYTIQTAGTYSFRVVAAGYGGTTTSTPQNIIAYTPAVITSTPTASPAQGTLTQSFTLSIDTSGISGSDLTYQWQEQINGAWTDISGATTIPYTASVSDTAGKTHTYRLKASNAGSSAESGTTTYRSYAAPVFTALNVPTSVNIPGQITFSATATDALSIIYQISTNQASWSEITSPYSITETGTYYFRAYATGYGGSTYSQIVTITASDVIPAFTSASVTPAAGIIPFDVTFTASATNNPTYTWYETTSGSLVEIGRGQTIRHTLNAQTAIGVHKFICVAENQYGDATSNELTVTAGVLPDTRIVTPAAGDSFTENTAVTFRASAAHGPATYVWTFPDGTTAEGETVTHTFTTRGSATVTVTGTNQYGSDTARVGIFIEKFYPGNRPKATGTLAVPDTQLYEDTLGYATSFNGDLENLNGLRETFEKPFTGVLGSALFYIILFGVPAFLIWFATGSAKIPAIIGIIVSGFIMVFFPDEWGANIFVLIITIIATGVIWIFVKRE